MGKEEERKEGLKLKNAFQVGGLLEKRLFQAFLSLLCLPLSSLSSHPPSQVMLLANSGRLHTAVEVTRYIKNIKCYQRPVFSLCLPVKRLNHVFFCSLCSQLVLCWEVPLGDGPSTNMAVRGPSCYVQYSLSLDGF